VVCVRRTGDGGDGGPSAGVLALDDFRLNLGRDALVRYLAEFGPGTDDDRASQLLRGLTGGHLDLAVEEQRVALIGWLRSWGSRHLRRADTPQTSEVLRVWWETWSARLPDEQITLNELGRADLDAAALAFDALRTAPAAARAAAAGPVAITLGDTAAAKAMFALRPQAFLPWDEPIRRGFGWTGGGAAYVTLLELSAAALDGLARRLAVPVRDLPGLLGRPRSTPPRLVDEFLWLRLTRDARRPPS